MDTKATSRQLKRLRAVKLELAQATARRTVLWQEQTEATDPKVLNRADLIVGKNRNGPVGAVPLFFHKEYTRFDNWGSGAD